MKLSLFASLAAIAASAVAAPTGILSVQQHLALGHRLVETAPATSFWASPEQVRTLDAYIDVTSGIDVATTPVAVSALPKTVRKEDIVKPLLSSIDGDQIWNTISHLVSFHNRNAYNETGVASTAWLKSHIESVVAPNPAVTVELVKLQDKWLQSSIVVKIPGNGKSDEIVVVGAHLDSLHLQDRRDGTSHRLAPGADDNASGVATIVEALRAYIKSGHVADRNIEFQFYAAEEYGLLGSSEIAAHYRKQEKPIYAMLQNDMTGYNPPGMADHATLILDFTNNELSRLHGKILSTYTSLEVRYGNCGYACSDHASFTKYGYRSAFPFESDRDTTRPGIHSEADVMEGLNKSKMTEFAKGTLGYVIELGTL